MQISHPQEAGTRAIHPRSPQWLMFAGPAYGCQQRPADNAGQPLALNDIALFAVAGAPAGIGHLFGLATKFALSRTRGFLADAGAVTLTKNPKL
jgi:hypothetical protein